MRRLALLAAVVALVGGPAASANSPNPTNVTIAGDLQSELGCGGDWDPACAVTHLAYEPSDDVWQGYWTVPAGNWQYKAALNDAWDENYGLHAQPGGANVPLGLGAATNVKFYYDHKTHWITDNVNSVIAVAPGSFQSELGCPGDWDPGCLRSWLEDPDGDGIYTFVTTALPAGHYEAKVALNESWDVNYGQGGVPGGANIPFTVPVDNAKVTFSYDAATHVLTILAGHAQDDNVEWDGLRHDSRDTLYRTPGGAVPAGSSVKIRFRTFHDDVSSVKLRVYDLNTSSQQILEMSRVASNVSCYQASLASETCDFWQATLTRAQPDNLWYRFIVADGTSTAYYADDTAALDGGLGAPTATAVDWSYALMFYDPGFTAPSWAQNAVVYQIFPDRFRNGDRKNDPKTGDVRYDDPVLALPWGTKPEGYCRSYADAATSCPWRFDPNPPSSSPTIESPRGRDYMGGDLEGITEELDYLKNLGVNTLYLNPIFDARSNHRYDTADYTKIDPYLGKEGDWKKLVKEADKRGMRIVLDGVFNHMSSDSPFFDRYHHYKEVGACESLTSKWRSWFDFTTSNVPCGSSDYNGWFGFDSIPVLTKTNPDVQNYFIKASPPGKKSIAVQWLDKGDGKGPKDGADGWRLDVMGDSSFPDGYWERFRQTVKAYDPSAVIIGELWQKDSTLLRFLRGDRADSTMNYRLRDAVLGLLAPQPFDPKGFGDSGRILSPSEAASRLASIWEDYPHAAGYSLMDLLDSHDTARLLWQLTPGAATTADKEANAANVAQGKARLELASLLQFGVPGAPTIYYGDEVGVTGADDPDDRRTYPWPDTGGSPDTSLFGHYKLLAQLRRDVPALTAGDLRILLADDAAGTLAFGRKTSGNAAIVAVNRSGSTQSLDIPVAGYVPDGTSFAWRYGGNGDVSVAGGVLHLSLGPLSGALLATGAVDLEPPAAPTGLNVTGEGDGTASLAWNAVAGASSYTVYRSPVSGGGYVKAGETTGTSFTDTGLTNAQTLYYVVRALDAPGNESGDSNEVGALPHLTIGWANLQWPPAMTHTISVVNRTDNAYGQVWIDGVTSRPGATDSLRAQLGFGPHGSNPAGNASWTWIDAGFNTDAGNNDEFVASMLPEAVGVYDYLYRYSTTNGRDWLYADLDGPIAAGATPPHPGVLTVDSSGDTTAPAMPTGLHAVSASPASIEIAWDAVAGDPSLYGYEVLRADTAGGPYTLLARLTGTDYVDGSVAEGSTYYYVVRAVDDSFNRSANSSEVGAKAELRTVTLTFDVTVPASTDGTGRTVHIAGTLDRLDGGLPQWDPGATQLTRVDATHWTITFTGKETTQLEYKYTLGDWDHVEKDGACGEIANRTLTLSYGSTGTQTVNDTVPNWRNVAPCGN
jgi:glycosidase/fibronectin type 3 domain-containing protein